MSDSENYTNKKAHFDQMLTIYGRNPVLEAISDPDLKPQKLHLSRKNRSADVLDEIKGWATKRDIEIREHDPASLSRISKNSKQDQGVALDVTCPSHKQFADFLKDLPDQFRLIALDGITNPQNLGMIIRSVAASPSDGLLIGRNNSPKISPLVIKASAGTVFRAPLIQAENLTEALEQLSQRGTNLCVLDSQGDLDFESASSLKQVVYVLGNETEGVSADTTNLASHRLRIPMNRGVESLNVAVTAALVAFG
ncbi:MAG: RNA methyltransferase [Porticoccaceae bacterium]|nr:RNA methyltransferase [Porticoccaceae bacterium]